MPQVGPNSLVERFRRPDVRAIALMGSYARGDQGTFSDIDLVLFLKADGPELDPETHLIGETFVVLSQVTPSQVESWFTEPDKATACIAGLRAARALWDPDGDFSSIQKRAQAFVWDAAMQARANAWASRQMVGWIEEVQKGLEGLRTGDEGRLLNARYGLSWGLTSVMRVQRGVLITGDNATYPEVVEHLEADSAWARLSRKAFGIVDGIGLREQVKAGLRLYVLTAALLADALKPEDKTLVDEAVKRIGKELGEAPDRSIEATS
ncbi:MAG: hypothetical protein AMJ81_13725 [Phycisphaerae bacterium SM23_33]|nr:MAG: hypothetical protein AMJ81_13725 [Phycisphaerae bacterium SM23_33]